MKKYFLSLIILALGAASVTNASAASFVNYHVQLTTRPDQAVNWTWLLRSSPKSASGRPQPPFVFLSLRVTSGSPIRSRGATGTMATCFGHRPSEIE